MTTREFKLHVDASLYGFKFNGDNYATVSYGTMRLGENIIVEVSGIDMGPTLLCAITDREALVKQAESAAKVNAERYWENQPAEFLTGIIKGFAPYI
jgi:hypothetical protein